MAVTAAVTAAAMVATTAVTSKLYTARTWRVPR